MPEKGVALMSRKQLIRIRWMVACFHGALFGLIVVVSLFTLPLQGDTSPIVVRSHILDELCPRLTSGAGAWNLRRKILNSVRHAASQYQVEPELIFAVIAAESRCSVTARSHAGAQGLMQLMPSTARYLGVDDPYAIVDNVRGGTKYLKTLLERFDGNRSLALAAYNAGPTTVRRYKNRIPPYRETKQYVKRVLAYYQLLRGESYSVQEV